MLRWLGERNGYCVLLEGKSYGNLFVDFYRKLLMGRKDKIFGVKYQNILVRRHLLNYKDMFVGTPIYIRYGVVYILIFTSMIAIELYYLTQLLSFI